MAEKLILNANLICKADRVEPKKCMVEKVFEIPDSEFRKFIENPEKRNYYLPKYKELMGYYDDSYHGVLFVNMDNGDGLLVNSEGYDYARYSQYIPNAKDIIQRHEQSEAFDDLKSRIDKSIDRWLEKYGNETTFDIPLTDLIDDVNFGEIVIDYALDRFSADPRFGDCDLTPNYLEVTKRELVETKLYCPLKFMVEDNEEESSDLSEVPSKYFARYVYELNEHILDDIKEDEDAVERGLAAYLHSDDLDKKVYSIFPRVEARDGDLYGAFVIQSYGELDRTELIDVTQEMVGQAADGWGESYEQHPVTLGEDEVYVSFWNSRDDYYLKPESEVFPEQKIDQTMGGM